MNCGLCVDCKC